MKKILSLCIATGLLITSFNPVWAQWHRNKTVPSQFTNSVSRVATPPALNTSSGYRQALYNYASQGNPQAMRPILQHYRIDTPDYNGNTLLCESVYNKDYAAFTTLKRLGASTTHACINTIPDQTVAEFNSGYMNWARAVNAGQIAYGTAGKASGAVATSSGLSTGAIVGIGVGTAALIGGGVALAVSGGGSHSSSTQSVPVAVCSGHGTKDESGVCQCQSGWGGTDCATKIYECEPGYIAQNGTCYLDLKCDSSKHLHQVANACECEAGYSYEYQGACYAPLSCGTNGHQEGDKCVCQAGYTGTDCATCASGYIAQEGKCYAQLNCVNGTQVKEACQCIEGWEGDLCTIAASCEGYQATCATGFDSTTTCQHGNETWYSCDKCDDQHLMFGGQCYDKISCANGGTQSGPTTCDCVGGYYGTNCENAPLTCGEHGVWNATTHQCDCTDNYTGEQCQTEPETDLCADVNCGTNGTCSEGVCVCSNNYYGTNCENAPLTCGEHGAWNATTHQCDCTDNYTGEQCQTAPVESKDGYLFINGTYVADPTACPADKYGMSPACHDCPVNSHSVAGTRTAEGCICEADKFCYYNIHTDEDCSEDQVKVYGECYSQESCKEGYVDFNGTCTKVGECSSNELDYQGLCLSQGTCDEGLTDFMGMCLKLGKCSVEEINVNGICLSQGDCAEGEVEYPPSGGICQKLTSLGISSELANDERCGRHGAYSSLTSSCICTEGYYGETCQNPPTKDFCSDKSCGEYGVCSISTGKCVCKKGYSGENCTVAPTSLQDNSLLVQNTLPVNIAQVNSKEVLPPGTKDLIGKKTDDNLHGLYNGTTISVNNTEERNVYGLSWNGGEIDEQMTNAGWKSDGTIMITNKGNGNVYGMWGKGMEYMDNASNGFGGKIIIDNEGDGDVYGMWGTGNDYFYNMCISWAYSDGTGLLSIKNKGNGDVYGIHSQGGADYGFIDVAWAGRGMLDIYNEGDGNIYGLFGDKNVHTVYADTVSEYLNSQAIIQITNMGNGDSYALFGNNAHLVSNETLIASGATIPYANNAIYMTNNGRGTAVGMYNNGEAIYNSGIITINNNGSGNAIGIFSAGENTNVLNSGTITLNNTESANLAIGIYAKGGNVVNTGKIIINGTENAYGIYAEDGATVYNTGSIQIGDYVYKGNGALENFIYLNGASLVNIGKVEATVLNFGTSGNYSLGKNGNYTGETATGILNIESSVVNGSFDQEYTLTNALDIKDTSQLKLVSNSALFDARLAENGSDVIMTKKAFNTLTPNNSLASFLEQNYALGHNEAFYNELKNLGSALDFQKGLNNLTGKEVLDRFSYEDLTAVREMNLAMNQQMFANEDKNIFTTQGNLNQFSFKNGKASSGQFALSNKKISPNLWVGYAMSVTRLNTNDEVHNNTRNASLFQMAIPFHFNGNGVKMISTPMAGFARGHYNRTGFNDTSYKGTIEKRLFGVMNEIRYPLSVGGFELSPTIELNAIAYNQRGGEEHKPYSLTIQSENNLSVEAGVGLYAAKQYDLSSEAKLNLNAGMMLYREFADPYNMKLGMQGMSGHFNLYDEDRSSYRGVARLGLDYQTKDLDIYGSIQHYMEDDPHTNIKSGFKWKF